MCSNDAGREWVGQVLKEEGCGRRVGCGRKVLEFVFGLRYNNCESNHCNSKDLGLEFG
jgi:hypothetical protein